MLHNIPGSSFEANLREAGKEIRLILEAQSRILSNSNIVTVYGLVAGPISESSTIQALLRRMDDAVGVVMSYEEGGSLENLLYPDPSTAMWNLTMKDKICILTDVANGLQELHRVGIVHRDIKPANILLSCKGGRLHKSQLNHFLCLFVNDGLLVDYQNICYITIIMLIM